MTLIATQLYIALQQFKVARESLETLMTFLPRSMPDRHSRSNILYQRALVDLAVCYAGEGYDQEAARLMNQSLGLPPETDNIEILADCRIC